MNFARFLFSFEGRLNRAKYWLAGLVIVCWMIALAVLMFGIAKLFGAATPKSFGFNVEDIFRAVDPASIIVYWSDTPVAAIFKVLGTLLFLWVYVATSVKRLHDRNRSGWWLLGFFAAPGIYHQLEDQLGDSMAAAVVGLVVSILALWGFVELLFLRGTQGPNRFGADPLAPIETRPGWRQQDELEFVPHGAGPSPGAHVKREHD